MPVFIHLSNLIVDKEAIKQKYKGGVDQFRLDFQNYNSLFQEDLELFSLAAMNSGDFSFDKLLEGGLHYYEFSQRSDDFVILDRYGGCHWQVDWLGHGAVYAAHANCSINHIIMAVQLECLTTNDIVRMREAGFNPFVTIK